MHRRISAAGLYLCGRRRYLRLRHASRHYPSGFPDAVPDAVRAARPVVPVAPVWPTRAGADPAVRAAAARGPVAVGAPGFAAHPFAALLSDELPFDVPHPGDPHVAALPVDDSHAAVRPAGDL